MLNGILFLKRGGAVTEKNYTGSTIESFEQEVIPAINESGFIGFPIYQGISPVAVTCSCKTFFGDPNCTDVFCEVSSVGFCVSNLDCEDASGGGSGACGCFQD